MHDDFRLNIIRFNLLKKAENETLKLSTLESYFEDKKISNINKDELKKQLEHLSSENFLSKVSDNEYKITDAGRKEIEEVKSALEKL